MIAFTPWFRPFDQTRPTCRGPEDPPEHVSDLGAPALGRVQLNPLMMS